MKQKDFKKMLDCWTVSLEWWTVGHLTCVLRTVGLRTGWAVELLNCWAVELLDCWSVGLLDYWSVRLLTCGFVGLLNC